MTSPKLSPRDAGRRRAHPIARRRWVPFERIVHFTTRWAESHGTSMEVWPLLPPLKIRPKTWSIWIVRTTHSGRGAGS